MAFFSKKATPADDPQAGPVLPKRSWLGTAFGWIFAREIDNRVIDNFPTWQEFSERKLKEARESRDEEFRLPDHKVYVSSPLHWNFMYLLFSGGALALAWSNPVWAGYLIYGSILAAFIVALFVTFRDGLFFHFESNRLEMDGDIINQRHSGEEGEEPQKEPEKKTYRGLLGRKRTVFRSKLLQIHYQNILRTFESGARRTWVYQDASIADLETLMSQRGMKLAWTLIEVLPQLGLLGTLVGMTQMFQAFRSTEGAPNVSVLAGFATALGTTVMANLFVLVLRPLFMRNERSMHEILSTLKMLMAMFILPTQQFALERQTQAAAAAAYPSYGYGGSDRRLTASLEELSTTLGEFSEMHRKLDSGAMAQETAAIAQDVKMSLQAVKDAFDPAQLKAQQRSFSQLTEAVQGLAKRLEKPAAGGQPSERMEHDLMQLRLLTRDTLVLMDSIAGQLRLVTGAQPKLLSGDPRLRSQALGEEEGHEPGERRTRGR